jgi:hypothetical protein
MDGKQPDLMSIALVSAFLFVGAVMVAGVLARPVDTPMNAKQVHQEDASVEKPAHSGDDAIGAPPGTVAGRAPAAKPPEAEPSSPGAEADRALAEDRKESPG